LEERKGFNNIKMVVWLREGGRVRRERGDGE
jgi:hypothetical protein